MNTTTTVDDQARHKHAMRQTLIDIWGAAPGQSRLGYDDLQLFQRHAGQMDYYARCFRAWAATLPANVAAEPYHPCSFINADGDFDLPAWLFVPAEFSDVWEIKNGKPVA